MTLTINPPRPADLEPVTEILHGVAVTDPYRWMEEQSSPRTRKWLEEQVVYAREYLDAIPGRERIRKDVEELLAVEVISEPWKIRNRYFFMKRGAHQEQPVIMMREGKSGGDILLVDPAERGGNSATAVGILSISNDGRLLAYSIRRGGEDPCAVEFLDVDRRKVLSDRLPRGFCRGLAFSRDGKGFSYVQQAIDSLRPYYQAVYWHAFGTRRQEDPEIFFAGEDPKLRLGMFASPDGQLLAYAMVWLRDPRTIDFLIHDLDSDQPPRRIVERMEGVFCPLFARNNLIALTDWKCPNCRVVAIDLDRPDRDNWRELVPGSIARIRDFAVAGGKVIVGYVENAATRTEIFDLAGQRRGVLPCPPQGTARLFPCRSNSDTVFYRFSSFSQPPTIFCYDIQSGQQEVWTRSQVPFDSSSLEVERVHYPSKDGTLIPMFLVAQNGRRSSGPLPTFLTGYGGFGNSITPQFTAYATFLMEQGCLFAVANLRGGAEFGEEWHLAGKRHNRQNAIDDFIAAAEWLLANGHASPGKLAIGGGSNAGLLVGAALTQRPDLFRAVVCLGPLLDMLRYHRFDFADSWVDEYGSAENADDFPFLRAYSPYHRVQDGVTYPAVMLISGDADTRCNPMHVRKMAARLQAATSSGHPILLDYKPTWGHRPVQPLSRRIEALTDRLAFLCHELGVNV